MRGARSLRPRPPTAALEDTNRAWASYSVSSQAVTRKKEMITS